MFAVLYSQMPLLHHILTVQCNDTKVIALLKGISLEHGSPEMLKTNGGLQYVNVLFNEFAIAWKFDYMMSSLTNPTKMDSPRWSSRPYRDCSPEQRTVDRSWSWFCWPTLAHHVMASSHHQQKCCIEDHCTQCFPNMSVPWTLSCLRFIHSLRSMQKMPSVHIMHEVLQRKHQGQMVSMWNSSKGIWMPVSTLAKHRLYLMQIIGSGVYWRECDHF